MPHDLTAQTKWREMKTNTLQKNIIIWRYTRCVLGSVGVFLLLNTSVCLAEKSPEQIVKTVFTKIKQTGTPLPVLTYVHWETVYARLSEKEKSYLSIKNPKDLRNTISEFIKSPEKLIQRNLIQTSIEGLSAEKQEALKAQISEITEKIKDRTSQNTVKLKQARFNIGTAEINGNEAIVPLNITVSGQERNESIKLVKIDEKWYFPSIDLLSSKTNLNINNLSGNISSDTPRAAMSKSSKVEASVEGRQQ